MDVDPGTASNVIGLLNLRVVTLAFLGCGLLWLLALVLRRVFSVLQSTLPAHRLLLLQLETLFSFGLWLGGGSYLLVGIIQPPRELVLALTGAMAVSIGFALKDVAASILAGMILIFDRPFQVGDRVQFDNYYGDITRIGLRSVRLQTLTDDTVTVPNNKFLTDTVASGNAGSMHMMVTTEFHVDPRGDLDRAMALLREVALTSRFLFVDCPVVVTAGELALANRIVGKLTVKCYVLDTRYQEALTTDVTVRGCRVLQEAGIAKA